MSLARWKQMFITLLSIDMHGKRHSPVVHKCRSIKMNVFLLEPRSVSNTLKVTTLGRRFTFHWYSQETIFPAKYGLIDFSTSHIEENVVFECQYLCPESPFSKFTKISWNHILSCCLFYFWKHKSYKVCCSLTIRIFRKLVIWTKYVDEQCVPKHCWCE